MKGLFKTLKSLWSLVVGLKITGVELCKPWLTVHYPRQEVDTVASFRGHIELVPADGDPHRPRCIMCWKCVEICPSRCIRLRLHVLGEEPGKRPADEGLLLGPDVASPYSTHQAPPPDTIERVLDVYRVNYSLCSLCGLCVQSCPADAIRFSGNVYLVGTTRDDVRHRPAGAAARPLGIGLTSKGGRAHLMDALALIAYGFYLALILVGGVAAVRCRSLVRALLGLILTLFGVAGMYFLMAAPFMALMQILIYVGAVTVLIFFAIMLTRPTQGEAGEEDGTPRTARRAGLALLTGLLPAGILGLIVTVRAPQALPLKPELPLERLGQFLTGPYVLGFELISVVLLAAMAGAVVLGFERRKGA